MFIVYILMITCRYFGPSWLGAEFVRGWNVQLPDYACNSVRTRGSDVMLDSFKNSEYDQEIPHSQTADKPVALWGGATQQSRDTRKTNKAKQSALSSPLRWLDWTRSRWRNTSRSACLVVNPIKVGNFAFLFNCTRVGRTSDSMTVPTERLIY